MSVCQDNGVISISMWDFVNKCETLYQTRSHKKLEQKFQYWCSQCECAFDYGFLPASIPICPKCGLILDEFDWEELSGHNYEDFRGGYHKEYGEFIDDGYDPDTFGDLE